MWSVGQERAGHLREVTAGWGACARSRREGQASGWVLQAAASQLDPGRGRRGRCCPPVHAYMDVAIVE